MPLPAPFVGVSYALDNRRADVQRSVNLYPAPIESGSGKAQMMLRSIPGLVSRYVVGAVGRGAYEINGRTWVVVGSGLYELTSITTAALRGTLNTSTGFVSMASNTTQLVVVDGANGYVLTLADNMFAKITDPDFPTSDLTDYLDQYSIYAPTGDQKFFISALADGSDIDALDFASSEALPDDLIGFRVVNRELWLQGRNGTEVWFNTGNPEFPIERNNGSIFGVGCSAKWASRPFNNSLAWVGSDKDGGDGAWLAQGYQGARISNRAVEQAIASCTDIAQAHAYTHRIDGSVFYCLQLPGAQTTWCYDALTGGWHERCEFSDGVRSQHRISWCFNAFGKALGLGRDGVVYEWDRTAYTNAGNTLLRERITPQFATPDNRRIAYSDFRIDVEAGFAGSVMMRYSDDGGANYGSWDSRSLGAVGVTNPRQVRWLRCGSALDRVWHTRVTDPIPFNPINATVEMR
jgi:hypothetical protein